MSSLISRDQGLFDPTKRFAFTNITSEDFVSAWGGSSITVPSGETVELSHHLANKLVDEMVDKIMIGEIKLNETNYYSKHPDMQPNSYRAASQLGIPAARKVWEDQIVRELNVDEESPELQVMRAKIREELQADMSQEPSTGPVSAPSSLAEFSELSNTGKTVKAEPKAPTKIKKIKIAE